MKTISKIVAVLMLGFFVTAMNIHPVLAEDAKAPAKAEEKKADAKADKKADAKAAPAKKTTKKKKAAAAPAPEKK